MWIYALGEAGYTLAIIQYSSQFSCFLVFSLLFRISYKIILVKVVVCQEDGKFNIQLRFYHP